MHVSGFHVFNSVACPQVFSHHKRQDCCGQPYQPLAHLRLRSLHVCGSLWLPVGRYDAIGKRDWSSPRAMWAYIAEQVMLARFDWPHSPDVYGKLLSLAGGSWFSLAPFSTLPPCHTVCEE